LIVDDRDFLFV